MAFFNLIGGIKGLAIIALIAALGGYIWNQNRKLENAVQATELAVAQRDKAAGELEKALEVNKENQVVFDRLQEEKRDIQTALNNIEAARQRDSVVIGQLSAAIRSQAANPANQVKLSPVLQDVLKGIQAERARRQGAAQ